MRWTRGRDLGSADLRQSSNVYVLDGRDGSELDAAVDRAMDVREGQDAAECRRQFKALVLLTAEATGRDPVDVVSLVVAAGMLYGAEPAGRRSWSTPRC